MADYNYSFYSDDHGDYNSKFHDNSYSYSYSYAPAQTLTTPISRYEFENSRFSDYSAYNQVFSEPMISYSSSFFSEPEVIEFHPNTQFIDPDYDLMHTRYIVSYSINDFNEDDDVDYDPTPYGGGYDPSLAYGKPLSPSIEICYPRSTIDDSKSPLMDGFSYGSITVPLKKEHVEEISKKPQIEEPIQARDNGEIEKSLVIKQDEEQEEDDNDDGDGDLINYRPIWSDYENGYLNKGNEQDYNYEYEKKVPEIPSGYGSKAMDLCESLFGYWPCLSKKDDKNNGGGEVVDYGDWNKMNNWKGTADYLFGSSNSCGDWRTEAGIYESPIFGYERHYMEPLEHGEIYYDEHVYDCRILENDY